MRSSGRRGFRTRFSRLASDSRSLEIKRQAGIAHRVISDVGQLLDRRTSSPRPPLSLRPQSADGVHRQAGCAHRRIRRRSDRNPSPPTSHAGNATSTSLFATTATSTAILTTWQFLVRPLSAAALIKRFLAYYGQGNRSEETMGKKPRKTSTPTEQLETLLKSYALRRLQGPTLSKPRRPVKPRSKQIKKR